MSKRLLFKREALQADLRAMRVQTLELFGNIDEATFVQPIHPEHSPIGWHLGHIAFTEALWILEHCAGAEAIAPEYRKLFMADGLPIAKYEQLPNFDWILNYMAEVRSQVLDYLNIAPLEDQDRLWYWLLQHESQHNETIAFLLQLHQGQTQSAIAYPDLPTPNFGMICIPASDVVLGSDRLEVQNPEPPQPPIHIPTFHIDRYPITYGQYEQFITAGGYNNAKYWSPQGWRWVEEHQIQHPLYWQTDERWRHHPVYGVSHYEANAYAQWIGKRLPTELEWEKSACWKPGSTHIFPYPWGRQSPHASVCNYDHQVGQSTPVNAYPQGQSPLGCWDMLGNVWEWTDSCFIGYDGFATYPYRGYSQTFFNGEHRVMRGGSWATRQWSLRSSFRNWYHPSVREIFVGFRCAMSP